MTGSGSLKWLVILLLVIMAVGIALRYKDKAALENHTPPPSCGIDQLPDQESASITDDDSLQPSAQQEPSADPLPEAPDHPQLGDTPVMAEADPTEVGDAEPVARIIYTKDTLPSDKPGTYWVKDDDGKVEQVSVDVLGQGSAAGLYEQEQR